METFQSRTRIYRHYIMQCLYHAVYVLHCSAFSYYFRIIIIRVHSLCIMTLYCTCLMDDRNNNITYLHMLNSVIYYTCYVQDDSGWFDKYNITLFYTLFFTFYDKLHSTVLHEKCIKQFYFILETQVFKFQ